MSAAAFAHGAHWPDEGVPAAKPPFTGVYSRPYSLGNSALQKSCKSAMDLMTILFTGLDASPWMCTDPVAGEVLDAGVDDLLALQPAHASSTTVANTPRRGYQLLFGIS